MNVQNYILALTVKVKVTVTFGFGMTCRKFLLHFTDPLALISMKPATLFTQSSPYNHVDSHF